MNAIISHNLFQVHKAEKDFTCEICTLSFRHKNSLVRHMVQHSGDRPYACQVCRGSFSCQRLLKEHVKKIHPEQADKIMPTLEPSKKAIQPLHPTRAYQPIAPRAQPVPPPQFRPAPAAPAASFLAPGPNGSMFLITNPAAAPSAAPPPPPTFAIQTLGNGLQVITQQQPQLFSNQHFQSLIQPQTSFLLSQQQQPLTINPFSNSSASLTPSSVGTPNCPTPSMMSPTCRESSMLMPPTPEVPTPEPTKEPLLDIPQRQEEAELEISNAEGATVSLVNPDSVPFEVVEETCASMGGSSDSSEMTYRTQSGQKVQVNILERAILEIPELREELQREEQSQLDQARNPIMTSEGEKAVKASEEGQQPDLVDGDRDQEVMLQKQMPAPATDDDEDRRLKEEEEAKRKRLEEEVERRMKEEEEAKRMEAEVKRRMEEERRKRILEEEVARRLREEEEESEKKKSDLLRSQVEARLRESKRAAESSVKTEEATFDCELCGRKYKFENFLKVHQRRPCV